MSITIESIESLVQDANQAMRDGQIDAALNIYETIVTESSDHVVAHRALARLHTESARPEQAIQHWLTVKQLRPDISEASLRLARLYRKLGMVAQAIKAYEDFHAIVPSHAEPPKLLPRLRAECAMEDGFRTGNEPVALKANPAINECAPAQKTMSTRTQHIAVAGADNASVDTIANLIEQLAGVESIDRILDADSLTSGKKTVVSRRVPTLFLSNTNLALQTDIVVVFNRQTASGETDNNMRSRWLTTYTKGLEYKDGDSDTILLDYEAFLAAPEQHMERLCTILGLRFDSAAVAVLPGLAVSELPNATAVTQHHKTANKDTEVLLDRLKERYRRDFGVADLTIKGNIEKLLDTISDSQTLIESKRRTLLTAAGDPERDLKIRLRALDKSNSKIQQAAVTRQLVNRTDFDAYRSMQALYMCEESIRFHWDFVKYLNLDYWFNSKYQLARKLGLHENSPSRILDMGAGPGHFSLACKMLGHKVVATDIDCTDTGSWSHPHLYDALIEFFQLDRYTHRINTMENLPDFGGRFDLVTAFMIKFNVVLQDGIPQVWGAQEWDYFLRDVAKNQLTENGRIFLKMNMTGQDTSSKYVDDSVLEYFRLHGALIDLDDSTVDFQSVDLLKR